MTDVDVQKEAEVKAYFNTATEEEVEQAQNVAISILGPVGRLLHGYNVLPNNIVQSKYLGKIWYGDLTVEEKNNKLGILKEQLKDDGIEIDSRVL